jgi:SAM-dependent methyltransferase
VNSFPSLDQAASFCPELFDQGGPGAPDWLMSSIGALCRSRLGIAPHCSVYATPRIFAGQLSMAHSSPHFHSLRRFAWLRSGVYLVHEIKRVILDSASRDRKMFDRLYKTSIDPHGCLSDLGAECYAKQLQALDLVRDKAIFERVLEIGCGEGVFTELLASRCKYLTAVDLSPVALSRAATRCNWGTHVSFQRFDLRRGTITGKFDLIVVSAVLEYFHRPTVLWAARAKLVQALANGGFLLVDTTRANPVAEDAWWSKVIIRGRRINQFFERHPNLEVTSRDSTAICIQTLFRRIP